MTCACTDQGDGKISPCGAHSMEINRHIDAAKERERQRIISILKSEKSRMDANFGRLTSEADIHEHGGYLLGRIIARVEGA